MVLANKKKHTIIVLATVDKSCEFLASELTGSGNGTMTQLI